MDKRVVCFAAVLLICSGGVFFLLSRILSSVLRVLCEGSTFQDIRYSEEEDCSQS